MPTKLSRTIPWYKTIIEQIFSRWKIRTSSGLSLEEPFEFQYSSRLNYRYCNKYCKHRSARAASNSSRDRRHPSKLVYFCEVERVPTTTARDRFSNFNVLAVCRIFPEQLDSNFRCWSLSSKFIFERPLLLQYRVCSLRYSKSIQIFHCSDCVCSLSFGCRYVPLLKFFRFLLKKFLSF